MTSDDGAHDSHGDANEDDGKPHDETGAGLDDETAAMDDTQLSPSSICLIVIAVIARPPPTRLMTMVT